MPAFARNGRTLLESLWFLPAAMLVALTALAFGLVEIDRDASRGGSFVFGDDGAAARTVLSMLTGSLITVAGLSLSVTVLVLQLASSQFGPRVLPSFLADRFTQRSVGAFVGIFAFSLIALRSVGGGFVPRLSVTVAGGLGLAAVILLVAFVSHVSSHGDLLAARPLQPGHVGDVNLDLLGQRLGDGGGRVHVTAVPDVSRVLEEACERIACRAEAAGACDRAALEWELARDIRTDAA